MSESAIGGDLVLSARPATPEAFAAYGRLLADGDRAILGANEGGRSEVLVASDRREAGPRRVRHVQRFPQAKRLVIVSGDVASLLVVCGRGDPPEGPASAFRVPGGTGVLIDAGVWHAGPVPLADAPVLEVLEVAGPADRLDRRSIAEVLGFDGLRVMLPDELGAPGPGLDLKDETSVTIAPALRGRVRLACLALDGIEVAESANSLRDEGDRLADELRRQWGGSSPSEVPGLRPVRDLYRALGIDPTKTRPSSEALLRRVLQSKPLYRVNSLVDALNLCSLKTLVPFGVYDRTRVAGPVVLRAGLPGEGYAGIGRGRVSVEGRPCLADREGPFGNPTADSLRTRVTLTTTRALVVLYLPSTIGEDDAARFLDAAAESVATHCGGEETARRIVA
jgi:DNA/RNA-binding domain of Phe-tRNA-synthetase-like protein/ureidoglycolate hydrolase